MVLTFGSSRCRVGDSPGLIHCQTPHEKLVRILVSTEWEQRFPLASVIALSRGISDHTPLLLDTGRASSSGSQPLFKFELGWLL
jgi:endonuclease/exonuclease/phosphatase family metal-dependent hydrolase